MNSSTQLMKYSCYDCNFICFAEHEIILHWNCFSHTVYIPPVKDQDVYMELEGNDENFKANNGNTRDHSNDTYYLDNKENTSCMDFEFEKRNLKRKVPIDFTDIKKMKFSFF